MILLITYDLHNPGRDYDSVVERIQLASDSWIHPQGSVWIIDTQKGCASWRDELKKDGDENDEYFVVHLAKNWASSNMSVAETKWLKSDARTW